MANLFTLLFLAQAPTVFQNVHVIQVEASSASTALLSDYEVTVQNGILTGIGPPALAHPKDANFIDVGGAYLIPGLADLHVHLEMDEVNRKESGFPAEPNASALPLFVAHGVTTVRNMAGLPSILELRKDIRRGKKIDPHIYTTGPLLTNQNSEISRAVLTAEDANKEIQRQHDLGFDAIKLHAFLPAEVYPHVLDAAQRVNMPVDGHCPFTLSIWDILLDGRQRTLEHLGGSLAACHRLDSPARKHRQWPQFMARNMYQSEDRADLLAQAIARSRIWICPTLTTAATETLPQNELTALLNNPDMVRYVTASTRESWKQYIQRVSKIYSDSGIDLSAELQAKSMILRYLAKHQANIIAGTDTPARPGIPGRVLHEELRLYVAAGLTPLQALRTATLHAGRCLESDPPFGVLQKGARADLVFLKENPLDSLRALDSIHGVYTQKQWLDRTKLDALLRQATEAVAGDSEG